MMTTRLALLLVACCSSSALLATAADPFRDVQVPAVIEPESKNNPILISVAGSHMNLELCNPSLVPGVTVSVAIQQSRNEMEDGAPVRIWDFVGVLNVSDEAPAKFVLVWCTSNLQATNVWQRSTPVTIKAN